MSFCPAGGSWKLIKKIRHPTCGEEPKKSDRMFLMSREPLPTISRQSACPLLLGEIPLAEERQNYRRQSSRRRWRRRRTERSINCRRRTACLRQEIRGDKCTVPSGRLAPSLPVAVGRGDHGGGQVVWSGRRPSDQWTKLQPGRHYIYLHSTHTHTHTH